MKKWRKSRLIALLLALVLTVSFMPQIGARAADNFETDTAQLNDPDDELDDSEDDDFEDDDEKEEEEEEEEEEEPTPSDGDMITIYLEGVDEENPRSGNTVLLQTDENGMVEVTFDGGSYLTWDDTDQGTFTFPKEHASDIIITPGTGYDSDLMQLQILADSGWERLLTAYGSVSFAEFLPEGDTDPFPDALYFLVTEDVGEDPLADAYYKVKFDTDKWKIGGTTVTLEGYGIIDDPEEVELEDYNEFDPHEQVFLGHFDENTMSVMYTRESDNKEIICNTFYVDGLYAYTIVDISDALAPFDWEDEIYTFSVVPKQVIVEDPVRKATINMSAPAGRWIGITPIVSEDYPVYSGENVSAEYAGFNGMLAVSIEDSAPTATIENYNDEYTNKQVITYERTADTKNVDFKFHHKGWDVCVERIRINGKDYSGNLTFYKSRADWFSHFDKNGVTFEIKDVPVQTAATNVNKENYNIEVQMRPVTRDECYLSRFTWADDENAEEVFVSATYQDDKGVNRSISYGELIAAGTSYPYLSLDAEENELLIPSGAAVTMYVRPTHGHQIKKLTPSGLGKIEPIAAESGYTVTTDCGDFTLDIESGAAENNTDTTGSKKITAATIKLDQNTAPSGTVRLTVEDATPSDATMFDSALAEVNAIDEQANFEITSIVRLTLAQIVEKGGLATDAWESVYGAEDKLMAPATLSLTLCDDIDANDIAIFHDNVYIRRFNTENNTVTFDADSFSYFAIATRKVEKPLVKTDIEDAVITLSAVEAVYNGTDQMPKVEKVVYDGTELKETDDYTVKAASCINAGTYEIEVEGTGSYKGTAKTVFTVKKAPVTVEPGTLALKTKTYDATDIMEVKGECVVKGILPADADKVQLTGITGTAQVENKNAGDKHATFFLGLAQETENYELATASVEATGKIGKKLLSVSGLSFKDKEFDGNRYMILKSQEPVVEGAIAGDDVVVRTKSDRYLITGNASAGDKTRKLTKGIYAITGADGGNYYLKVGTTATGTIRPVEIGKVTLKKTSVKASKKAQKPVVTEVISTGGRKVLTKNYKVTYYRGKKATTDFTSKGKITVKVSGVGKNFTGTKTVTYTIK